MEILNVRYDNLTVPQALETVLGYLDGDERRTVFFLNADCLRQSQKDEEYMGFLNKADLVLSDGIGLRIASKLFGAPMVDNCNGTDFSPVLIEEASRQKRAKIFLFGGKDGVAARAKANLERKVPGVQVVGAVSGYGVDTDALIEEINASGADIVFVALGVPSQEKWIMRNRERIEAKVCTGVGALLDYLSDTIPRAPLWMRKCHLEWSWRIFVDPKRMVRRYLVDGVGFMIYLVGKRMTGK
jgi:exopolysaccharide biosynthesis WecB/TagA/CpsF family protein